MKRTTIMLPDDLSARLRYEARRRGVSLADVAREAIASYLPERDPQEPLSFIGLGTGAGDEAAQTDREVARLVGERYDGESRDHERDDRGHHDRDHPDRRQPGGAGTNGVAG